MRLIRSMRLTASVRLIERADIEGGANDLVRFKTVNNRDRACRVREPSQALAFFDENLLDSLGPRVWAIPCKVIASVSWYLHNHR